MAFTIQDAPRQYAHLSEQIFWRIRTSDLGTFPISKEIAAQLYINGNAVTDIRTVKPSSTNDAVIFNFTDIVGSFLRTSTAFTTSSMGAHPDSTFKATIKLKYGEAIYNSEDCTQNIIDVSNETSEVYVFNSHVQYLETDFIVSSGYIFSDRPSCYTLPLDVGDRIAVLGNSTLEIKYYRGELVLATQTANYSGDEVHHYGIGTNLNVFEDTCTHYTVRITAGVIDKTYTIGLDKSNRKSLIYFLEPKGSYTPYLMDGEELRSVDREADIVSISDLTANSNFQLARFGDTAFNSEHYEKVRMSKKAVTYDDNEDYHLALANSANFVKYHKGKYIKIIVQGEIPYYHENNIFEIIISGYIATRLQTHQFT